MLGAAVVLIFPCDRIHLKVKVALMAVDFFGGEEDTEETTEVDR